MSEILTLDVFKAKISIFRRTWPFRISHLNRNGCLTSPRLLFQELAKEMMGLKMKGGIDGMLPETKEQFDELEKAIGDKLQPFVGSEHYQDFAEKLIKRISLDREYLFSSSTCIFLPGMGCGCSTVGLWVQIPLGAGFSSSLLYPLSSASLVHDPHGGATLLIFL